MDMYIDQLTQYQSLTETETNASHERCKILAGIQADMLARHGDTQCSGYRKDAKRVTQVARITKRVTQVARITGTMFRRDVAVGQYLLQHGPSTMTKTEIYRKHIAPPKAPKVSKPKDAPAPVQPSSNDEFYLDILRSIRGWVDSKTRTKWEGMLADLNIDPRILK